MLSGIVLIFILSRIPEVPLWATIFAWVSLGFNTLRFLLGVASGGKKSGNNQ